MAGILRVEYWKEENYTKMKNKRKKQNIQRFTGDCECIGVQKLLETGKRPTGKEQVERSSGLTQPERGTKLRAYEGYCLSFRLKGALVPPNKA